jgi:hypothetical protein
MAGTFDYYLLVQVMASGPIDRETFVAVLKSARAQLSTEDYVLLQQDLKALFTEME